MGLPIFGLAPQARLTRWRIARSVAVVRMARQAGVPPVAGRPLVLYAGCGSSLDGTVLAAVAERLFPERVGLVLPPGRNLPADVVETWDAALSGPETWIAALCDAAAGPSDGRDCWRNLAELAGRRPDAAFVPLAIRYVGTGGRLPEALIAFGRPVPGDDGATADAAGERLSAALAAVQDGLARLAAQPDATQFATLIRGGNGGFGDLLRWFGRRSGVAGLRPEGAALDA
ncbi:MAG TPA: hypothetical protein VEH84_04195 [Alphaproteobacteria bacterium]|nr:hypothetical protein [Alphaproteobacteria bacterium]